MWVHRYLNLPEVEREEQNIANIKEYYKRLLERSAYKKWIGVPLV
jgi:flagellar motility protein MotE (MotC chaperone)